MKLNTAYEKLYKQWLREFQSSDLTPLSQSSYEEYQLNGREFNDLKPSNENKIENLLTESYKKNFNYLLTDLLKMREIKLINAALALQEIDFTDVIEAEKLLFQNLVASFKGFDKMKKITVDKPPNSTATAKGVELDSLKKKKEDEETQEDIPISAVTPAAGVRPTTIETVKNESAKPNEKEYQQVAIDDIEENYDYILIRFLKKTPPIVGIDLMNYGPYEKEEIASIPYKNARILIDEKFAEQIELGS